jgi:hypothetical protein
MKLIGRHLGETAPKRRHGRRFQDKGFQGRRRSMIIQSYKMDLSAQHQKTELHTVEERLSAWTDGDRLG